MPKRLILAFDSWLVHRVEKVSRWIQVWTGWNCFRQSRACYVAAALCQLWNFVKASAPTWMKAAEAPVLGAVVLFYAWLALSDDLAEQMNHAGFANHWFITFVSVGCYLGACDPLPPSKGKVREWWASLGKQPAAVTVGA